LQFGALSTRWLQADVIAGLTVAAIVIPKAMAYATIAGLPVQIGLYTALVPMVVYAFLGTSRPLSVSTTTTIAILSAAALGAAVPSGDAAGLVTAAATLAVMVGALLAAAGALKLGFIANFISDPVLAGFKTGIGFVIVVDQLPKLLGIKIHKEGFFRDLWSIVQGLDDTQLATLGVTVGLFAFIVLMERFVPKAPTPLLAVALGIGASAAFGLTAYGIKLIGEVPSGLPLPVMPALGLGEALWPAAIGIALMSFTETIAAGRAFAASDEPRLTPNRELFALGAANAVGGLFGAMPAGGGTSQTAVARRAGARSQAAGLVCAAATFATLLFLAPVIGYMPQAVLAAVVVAYSLELIQPKEFVAIRKVRVYEFRWALVACLGVMVLGTLKGILVAVILSLLSLAQQAYDPPVYRLGRKKGTQVFRKPSAEHPDDERWPGLALVRLEGRAFFLNAQRIADHIGAIVAEDKPRVVVLDCSAVIDIEYSALKMLDEGERQHAAEGIELWLAALNPAVLEMVKRSALGERLGRERMFFTVERAVEAFEARDLTRRV
jgi:high affinity sulfate transporter 1